MPVDSIFHKVAPIAMLAIFSFAQKAVAQCKVVDRMPQYWNLVSQSGNQSPRQQVTSFRTILGLAHTDLYSKTGVGFETDDQLDHAILKALGEARQNRQVAESMSTKVRSTFASERGASAGSGRDLGYL